MRVAVCKFGGCLCRRDASQCVCRCLEASFPSLEIFTLRSVCTSRIRIGLRKFSRGYEPARLRIEEDGFRRAKWRMRRAPTPPATTHAPTPTWPTPPTHPNPFTNTLTRNAKRKAWNTHTNTQIHCVEASPDSF